MLTGTNLTHAKKHNLQIIHETIRLYGPISRADVARRTQLTAQTISNLVRQLLDDGLVLEVDRLNSGRGAPGIRLAVNPDAAFSVGLDLDVDHLTAVLVDLSGKVQQQIDYDLSEPTPEEGITLMTETVRTLLDRQGLDPSRVWGIGVGIPGPMVVSSGEFDTYEVSPRALRGWRSVRLAELLHERLRLPVYIENNATAAAVGEHWYGAGRHVATFFYVYLGSGLGGGLVVQGHPFEGHSGNAGELGYLPCVHTNTGHERLDHIGEVFNLRDMLSRMRREGEEVSSLADLVALYETRRPAFMHWLEEASEQLAASLFVIEYVLDPEVTFIGGRWPTVLLEALRDRAAALLPERRIGGKQSAPPPRLATAGTDAAALGVATLPLYSAFGPASRMSLKLATS
jgi:predicted NBD/HSP70 family sugar kinase